ncbi:MAG: GNAT family N-acetyltransferase [Pseudomonadota bacterium]|nr:GNAT family N-acetyltransferase [Pseudomonadota bacterium]
MTDGVLVREAVPEDAPALARIAARAYRAAFGAILEPEALALRDTGFFAERFGEAWPRMRVAKRGRRALGFSLVTGTHLDMLFVDSEAAGEGAGSALLRRVEAEGTRTLEAFRDNHAARAFYERRGWTLRRDYERDFLGRSRAFVLYGKDPA